jgi:hypothetical protein
MLYMRMLYILRRPAAPRRGRRKQEGRSQTISKCHSYLAIRMHAHLHQAYRLYTTAPKQSYTHISASQSLVTIFTHIYVSLPLFSSPLFFSPLSTSVLAFFLGSPDSALPLLSLSIVSQRTHTSYPRRPVPSHPIHFTASIVWIILCRYLILRLRSRSRSPSRFCFFVSVFLSLRLSFELVNYIYVELSKCVCENVRLCEAHRKTDFHSDVRVR